MLSENDVTIATPEHLLAACFGLGITNLTIEIDHTEIPIMDGSALFFVDLFRKTGIIQQPNTQTPHIITTQTTYQNDAASITITPSDTLTFTYNLSYPDSFIGTQTLTYTFSSDSFIGEPEWVEIICVTDDNRIF